MTRRKSKIRAYRLHVKRWNAKNERVVCLLVVEFTCFTKIASKCEKRTIDDDNLYSVLTFRFFPPPLFCKSLSNRFLSKIYICIYLCICIPRLFFRTFRPRRRSPTQRSSLTYGYSNDQGILDGSDMESLGRRCPPSESAVSIFYRPP